MGSTAPRLGDQGRQRENPQQARLTLIERVSSIDGNLKWCRQKGAGRGDMHGNGLTRFALAFILIAVLSLSAMSAYLRSFNEVSLNERERGGIKTRIGDYVSFDPIGTLPISLITALKRWPTSRDCIENETSHRLLWRAFRSSLDLKVCLTRLISGVHIQQDIDTIFQENGFKSSPPLQRSSGSDDFEYEYSCERSTACSKWAERQGYFFIRPYSLSVKVTFSNNTLLNVSIIELLE